MSDDPMKEMWVCLWCREKFEFGNVGSSPDYRTLYCPFCNTSDVTSVEMEPLMTAARNIPKGTNHV